MPRLPDKQWRFLRELWKLNVVGMAVIAVLYSAPWLREQLPDGFVAWLDRSTLPYIPVDVEHRERIIFLVAGWLAAIGLVWLVRRVFSRRDAIPIASFSQIESVAPKTPPLKRWLPGAFGWLGIFLLLVPFVVQPFRIAAQPFEEATFVGVNDTSDSMLAEDVAPNRGVASQRSYLEFMASSPEEIQHSLVTFGGAPSLLVPPTTDRQFLEDAASSAEFGRETALLDGVDMALDVCERLSLTDDGTRPCRIALLSDGAESVVAEDEREQRASALVARANSLGVSIDSIGFGSDEPTQYHGELVRLVPDKDLLRRLSVGTGGNFFEAANASELSDAYDEIGSAFGYDYIALTAWEFFVALAFFCFLVAGVSWLGFFNQYNPRRKQKLVDDGEPHLKVVA